VTPQVGQLLPGSGDLRAVTLGAEPVALRGGLALTADSWLRTVDDPDRGGWHVDLAGYAYAFDSGDSELIAFHWHRTMFNAHREPHVHVGGSLAKAHVPTGGPVPLVAVLRFAIRDLGVEAIRPDWEQVLQQAELEDLQAGLGLTEPFDPSEAEDPDA
jgi:hypothetical protein